MRRTAKAIAGTAFFSATLALGAGQAPAAWSEAMLVQYYSAYPQHGSTPDGGYHVNRYGYGNYTRGADGGFGGYPAGSAGAQILQEQQRRKCEAVPESC